MPRSKFKRWKKVLQKIELYIKYFRTVDCQTKIKVFNINFYDIERLEGQNVKLQTHTIPMKEFPFLTMTF